MTGEMMKPENADKGEEYWTGRTGALGMGGAIGDPGMCIRPNYPDYFNLADELLNAGFDASVEPFDVYQGPYVHVSGVGKIWGVWNEMGDVTWYLERGRGGMEFPYSGELVDYLENHYETYPELTVGTVAKITQGSGIDSGKVVKIVSPYLVKTDGMGIPTNIEGAYKPVDWNREVAIEFEDGRIDTMFKSRLVPVEQDVEVKKVKKGGKTGYVMKR